MRCSPRQPTYAVNLVLLLILITLSFGGVLDRAKIEKLAEKKLKEEFGEEVKLREVKVFLRKPLKFSSVESISLKLRRGYPRGTLHIEVKTPKGLKRISAPVEVLWRCELIVAQEPIERGERVYPWQVGYITKFMSRCPNQGISSIEELIDYVALRRIEAQEPLRKNLLKKEPLIRRGEEIDIVFRSGNLEISLRGKALDTGFYGDTIRVKSLNSGKVLRGRVVSENSVIIK